MGIRPLTLAAALAVVALLVAGCGRSDTDSAGASVTPTGTTAQNLSGRIEVDGSSTVGPFVTAGAEDFQQQNSGVQVTVGIPGPAAASSASAPVRRNLGRLAPDQGRRGGAGLSEERHRVHRAPGRERRDRRRREQRERWATCLTVEQLNKIWAPDSKVKSWKEVDPGFPDEKLTLAGPGTDSGTFDFFTKEINGEEDASRTDYQATEDDNVIVQAVEGDKGGLGYFGLSYYEQNKENLKDVQVDSGAAACRRAPRRSRTASYTPSPGRSSSTSRTPRCKSPR